MYTTVSILFFILNPTIEYAGSDRISHGFKVFGLFSFNDEYKKWEIVWPIAIFEGGPENILLQMKFK